MQILGDQYERRTHLRNYHHQRKWKFLHRHQVSFKWMAQQQLLHQPRCRKKIQETIQKTIYGKYLHAAKFSYFFTVFCCCMRLLKVSIPKWFHIHSNMSVESHILNTCKILQTYLRWRTWNLRKKNNYLKNSAEESFGVLVTEFRQILHSGSCTNVKYQKKLHSNELCLFTQKKNVISRTTLGCIF